MITSRQGVGPNKGVQDHYCRETQVYRETKVQLLYTMVTMMASGPGLVLINICTFRLWQLRLGGATSKTNVWVWKQNEENGLHAIIQV